MSSHKRKLESNLATIPNSQSTQPFIQPPENYTSSQIEIWRKLTKKYEQQYEEMEKNKRGESLNVQPITFQGIELPDEKKKYSSDLMTKRQYYNDLIKLTEKITEEREFLDKSEKGYKNKEYKRKPSFFDPIGELGGVIKEKCEAFLKNIDPLRSNNDIAPIIEENADRVKKIIEKIEMKGGKIRKRTKKNKKKRTQKKDIRHS